MIWWIVLPSFAYVALGVYWFLSNMGHKNRPNYWYDWVIGSGAIPVLVLLRIFLFFKDKEWRRQ